VLMERWPIRELQSRLDEAKKANPASTTLGDFRADADLMRAENEALAAAARVITPHRGIAGHFGNRAWLLEWTKPEPLKRVPSIRPSLFFPASLLGRKGAFELAEALAGGIDVDLVYLGRADEGAADPFANISCGRADVIGLASAHALVIPAWIEHQPRLALLALASGIPVIASRECGLPSHPLLHELGSHDPGELRSVIQSVLFRCNAA